MHKKTLYMTVFLCIFIVPDAPFIVNNDYMFDKHIGQELRVYSIDQAVLQSYGLQHKNPFLIVLFWEYLWYTFGYMCLYT